MKLSEIKPEQVERFKSYFAALWVDAEIRLNVPFNDRWHIKDTIEDPKTPGKYIYKFELTYSHGVLVDGYADEILEEFEHLEADEFKSRYKAAVELAGKQKFPRWTIGQIKEGLRIGKIAFNGAGMSKEEWDQMGEWYEVQEKLGKEKAKERNQPGGIKPHAQRLKEGWENATGGKMPENSWKQTLDSAYLQFDDKQDLLDYIHAYKLNDERSKYLQDSYEKHDEIRKGELNMMIDKYGLDHVREFGKKSTRAGDKRRFGEIEENLNQNNWDDAIDEIEEMKKNEENGS